MLVRAVIIWLVLCAMLCSCSGMTPTLPTSRWLCKDSGDLFSLNLRIKSGRDFGFDTESSGPLLKSGKMLNVHLSRLTGVSFAFPDGATFYVPVGHKNQELNVPAADVTAILADLARANGKVWAHNWEHDLLALRRYGFMMPDSAVIRDSYGLMWALNKRAEGKSKFGLKALVKQYFDYEMQEFDQLTGGRQFEELPPKEVIQYVTDDAWFALQLGLRFEKELEKYV